MQPHIEGSVLRISSTVFWILLFKRNHKMWLPVVYWTRFSLLLKCKNEPFCAAELVKLALDFRLVFYFVFNSVDTASQHESQRELGRGWVQNRARVWRALAAEEKLHVGTQGQVPRRSVGLPCPSVHKHWVFRMQVSNANTDLLVGEPTFCSHYCQPETLLNGAGIVKLV